MTAETPNWAARSVTRARPCSSTIRAMCSWRSRAKTSPGEALAGTVTPLLAASGLVGDRAVGFVWFPTHSSPRQNAMSRRLIEINRKLWQAVRTTDRARSARPPPPPAPAHLAPLPGSRHQPARTRTIAPDSERRDGRPAREVTEADVDQQPGRRRGAASPADRTAVVGLRQLRDPIQGLRPEGRAARPRTRRSRTPRRSIGFTGVAPTRRPPHPVGPGRRLRRPGPPRGRPRGRPGNDQLERLPGRRLHARQRLQPRCPRPPEGARPSARVRRRHGRDGLARPEAVVLGRDQLSRARTTSAPARTGWPRRSPRSTRGSGPDQRMLLEYKFFEPSFYTMDVPDWGTAYIQCVAAGPEGQGRRRHRPPRAGHEHRVHRRVAAPRRIASAGSTSTRGSTPTTT